MFRVAIGLLLLIAPGAGVAGESVSGAGGVVAAEHRLASAAGVEILARGGNAVDAAVAAALAVGVVNPSSCGIGGGGFMVIFDRASRQVHALDYRETAPAAAHRDMYVRDGEVVAGASTVGGLAVATPGDLAGAVAALERFGSLPLSVVAQPAIRLAREGFAVEEHLAGSIAGKLEEIRRHPALAAILLRPDGSPVAEGERLRQPDLARTLEAAAADAGADFYRGAVAEAIVAAVRASGGVLDASDLRQYRPIWRRPVRGRFDGYDIFSMPPPSSGGGVLLSVLEIIDRDDLRSLEHNSPTYLHLLAEALQFAFADRAADYGDPDFVTVPLDQLLAPDLARRRRHRLSAARTQPPSFYGGFATADDGGTSHLSVVDAAGNAVALTTSINTGFGSKVAVPGTGIILNNTMDDFSARPGVPNVYGLLGSEANAIAPRKRPLSSMTPTIVLRDGTVAAVAGGSGGPLIITGTLQALLNVVVFEFDAAAAVSAPRLHHQWMPPVLMLESGIPEIEDFPLRRLGHRIHRSPRGAAVQLIRQVPGGYAAASDPRKGGLAAAVVK